MEIERSTPIRRHYLLIPGSDPLELPPEKPFVIGRSSEVQLTIPSQRVSRRHAEIVWRAGLPVVRNLSSTNPTLVNERAIDEHELRDHDELQIGPCRCVYRRLRGLARADETGSDAITELTENPDIRFATLPDALPVATVGIAYQAQILTEGGIDPLTFDADPTALPLGLALDSVTGQILGVAIQTGQVANFLVLATDADGLTTQNTFQIATSKAISIDQQTLPDTTIFSPYNSTLTATGGTLPHTWEVVNATVPPGLTLNRSTGQLAGNTITAGSFAFTVTVTDTANVAGQVQATVVFQIDVN